MGPARMFALLAGLRHMSVCRMGMVSCFFVTSGFVVFGCFIVMASRVSMMLGGALMVFGSFLGHDKSPWVTALLS
jgi:hypothetical protein